MTCPEQKFHVELVALLPRLLRFALSLTRCKENAEDLVQTTCERALGARHQWKVGTRLDAWLFTIQYSVWKNQLRTKGVRKETALELSEPVHIVDGAQQMEQNLVASIVLASIKELPHQQQTVLLMVYGEGYTYREASEILQIPIGTVMSRLAQARLAMAERHGKLGRGGARRDVAKRKAANGRCG